MLTRLLNLNLTLKVSQQVLNELLWHRRLGHLNHRYMRLLKNKYSTGIDCDNFDECIACIQGKMSRKPFPTHNGRRSHEKLELIHADIVVVNESTFGKARYFLTLVDDYTSVAMF